jgi:hypothetical protein
MSTRRQGWHLCRKYTIIKHINLFQIIFPFGKEEKFSFSTLIIIRKFITPTFQLQSLQNLVQLYNRWKVQSWRSVSSLNTFVPEIYVGLPSISYLVCRGSLQTSCDIFSRITFKKKFWSTEYPKVIYFYWMKEQSDLKVTDCFSFDFVMNVKFV